MSGFNTVLESLNDLKLESGLIPKLESFFIRQHLLRILDRLCGMDIVEINSYFKEFDGVRDKFDEMKKDPDVIKLIKMHEDIINKAEASCNEQFKIPEKPLHQREKSMLVELFNLFKDDPDSPFNLDNAPYICEQLLPGINFTDKHMGLIALYLYYIAIQKAKEIDSAPYYRLGKISKYLTFSYALIELSSYFRAEFSAIKTKEDEEKQRKINSGKKGGDKKRSKYSPLKEKVIELYDLHYKHKVQDKNLSYRQASKIIAKELENDIKGILTTSEPENTIDSWIRKHDKK